MAVIWQTFLERRDDLFVALWQHVQLSLLALLIGVVIAVPLAIFAQPHPKLANGLLQVTGVLQTIPSLALLGLLIPLVGIGSTPALIALVVYALLPIFQNTYVGLDGIDPAYEEAATAFGMRRGQKLLRVELPLALPVIISGIRTAAVMVIGTATLAALIGAGGLGTFIILGINRNDPALTVIGALAAALLAIVVSFGLAWLQRLSFKRMAMVLGAVTLLVGGASVATAVGKQPVTITVAGKLGSEPDILINMYKLLIKEAKPEAHVTLKPNFGQTSFLYQALLGNNIDLYPEFTGTVVSGLLKPNATQQAALDAGDDAYPIAQEMLAKKGLTLLTPMQYNNTYAVVVKQSFAKQHQLSTISDLAKLNQPVAGFDLEFTDRTDGYKGIQQRYGLTFKVKTLDPALRYQALADGAVDLTDGYATDAEIRRYKLVALKDDRQLFPVYRGAPLMSLSFAKRYPELVTALNKLGNRISATDMQEMNYQVSVKKRAASAVARQYLLAHKLIKEGTK